MKKETLEKKIKEGKKIIFEYINKHIEDEDNYVLDILDNDNLKKVRKGYHAVTFPYLYKYVGKGKISRRILSYILINEFLNKNLKSFRCGNINKVIFTNYKIYGTWDYNEISNNDVYNNLIKNYKQIKSYLEK